MAESNEREQTNLNTFQGKANSKTVEKETVNIEETEIDKNTSTTSIDFDIDEDIAAIQAEAIKAVANAMQNIVASTSCAKPCNLDIEAALNSSSETSGEGTSRGHRVSRTECQLAADIAENTSRDARLVAAMGEDLMERMISAVQVLQSLIQGLSEKALEATERGTEHDYRAADFYHSIASKYESTIAALERKTRQTEVAVNRVQKTANECQRYAELAEEINDETLEESRLTKFAACWWTNKGRAAIIVCLKIEHSALLMLRRMWNTVRDDMQFDERNITADSDTEETQKCQNRDRKTKIAHAVVTLVGLALLSVTSLFKPGSDSFNAILTLGLLTTVWCAGYWSHKYYKCLKGSDHQQTANETAIERHQDEFLENCDRRLEIIRTHLLKYNIIVDSDAESDTGSAEATAFELPR